MTSQMNEIFESLTDAEVVGRFKKSIEIQNDKKKAMGCPIAGYDEENDVAYLEYPDGRREYAR